MSSEFQFAGKRVLITGASSGLGREFAEQLAPRCAGLVLVARRGELLHGLAERLREAHGVEVHVVVADLAAPEPGERLLHAMTEAGLSVDVLINNAGFATYGRFGELTRARQREEIDLNVSALVELSHAFLPSLLSARGGIINVASTAAFQPVPHMAVYAASKAFVLHFSEALAAEYREQGLRVLALCPGSTNTEFFDIVGTDDASRGQKADPRDVVERGLQAFVRGRSHFIHGWNNYLTAQSPRFMSRRLTASICANVMRPRGLPPPRRLPVPGSGSEG